jgi:hypothetical protein
LKSLVQPQRLSKDRRCECTNLMTQTLQEELEDYLQELEELAEVYLEFKVMEKNTDQISLAILQVTRITRRLEERIRKEQKRDARAKQEVQGTIPIT